MNLTANQSWPLSRWLASGVGAVVVFTVIGVASLRVTGYQPDTLTHGAEVATRVLRFEDVSNGLVNVYEEESGELLVVLEPIRDSFVRGIMRSMARARRARDIGTTPPFSLTQYEDGALILTDTAVDNEVNLAAFGPTNLESFKALLTAPIGRY